jgi:mRNA interferase RelE/StbE
MIVHLRKTATKYLDSLNKADRERISAALINLEKEPPQGDIKTMKGQPGRFRLRVGSYRALFHIENGNIVISHIESRGQAYKKKNRGK